jgi:hypothetical protein
VLADLLALIGREAPAEMAELTAERLERMGARPSGAAIRALAV